MNAATKGWRPVVRVGMPLPAGTLLDLGVASGLPLLFSANAFARNGPHREFAGFNLRAAENLPEHLDAFLDSAGFVAAAKYGDYRWSVDQYLDLVATRHWAAWSAMDYCVEPQVAADAATRRLRIDATVAGYFTCRSRAAARCLPAPLPVCQGLHPDEYLRCCEQLALDSSVELLGVGSVCRRHLGGPDGLVTIVAALDAELPSHVKLHLFGVKGGALKALQAYAHRIASVDSMAWDMGVRRAVPVGRTQALRATAMVDWHGRQMACLGDAVTGGVLEVVRPAQRLRSAREIAEDAVGGALADLHCDHEISYREAAALVHQDATTVRAILSTQGCEAFREENPDDDFGLGVVYSAVRDALIGGGHLCATD